MDERCKDCGAILADGALCEGYFHQMLFWEAEEPANGRVHHLTVLCYHLQHPALYSPEGLAYGRQLLRRFVVEGESPQTVRQRSGAAVDSGKRQWKIKGTDESHGFYPVQVSWPMNAADVVAGGIENYCENVKKWAAATHERLVSLGLD
jgi:hypothetical protein